MIDPQYDLGPKVDPQYDLGPKANWETAGGQVIHPDWTNVGGQVINPNVEPSIQEMAKKGSYADMLKVDLNKGVDSAWNRIGANVQAGYTGVLELGSSLAKLADILGLAPKGTAQKAQSAYNEASKIYESGQYPETAASKIIGTMLPTTLLSAPIGLLSKLGGAVLGTLGEYIGAGAGGALSGAVTGGLLNTPGNDPNDVFNEAGAKSGAILGGLLGPAGQFLSNYGKATAAYQVGKEGLENAGYTGPVLARDFGNEALANFKSVWMDNIVDSSVRNTQLQAITPAIKQLLGSVIDKTEKQAGGNVGNVIRNISNNMEEQSSAKWTDLFNAAKSQGISKIDTTVTKQSASEFLDNYSQYLSKNDRNLLTLLSNAKKVDFNALNRTKGSDIWAMSEKFARKEGTVYEDMADAMKNIYWNITDDIGNTLKSKPELYSAWEQAKAFTSGVKTIFNVKNNRQLVNAIDDVNETTGHLKTFINSVLDPVSEKSAGYYNKALGSDYQKAVSDMAFNKIFNDSFNTEAKGLNLTKFFKGIGDANDAHILNNDTVKSLGVLENYFNKIQTAQEAAKQSGIATHLKYTVPFIKTSAIGYGFLSGGVPGAAGTAAAVLLGPALLSKISKASPLKNLLIAASNVYRKNPAITELLMDKIGKQLTNAGVIINNNGVADIKKGIK